MTTKFAHVGNMRLGSLGADPRQPPFTSNASAALTSVLHTSQPSSSLEFNTTAELIAALPSASNDEINQLAGAARADVLQASAAGKGGTVYQGGYAAGKYATPAMVNEARTAIIAEATKRGVSNATSTTDTSIVPSSGGGTVPGTTMTTSGGYTALVGSTGILSKIPSWAWYAAAAGLLGGAALLYLNRDKLLGGHPPMAAVNGLDSYRAHGHKSKRKAKKHSRKSKKA